MWLWASYGFVGPWCDDCDSSINCLIAYEHGRLPLSGSSHQEKKKIKMQLFLLWRQITKWVISKSYSSLHSFRSGFYLWMLWWADLVWVLHFGIEPYAHHDGRLALPKGRPKAQNRDLSITSIILNHTNKQLVWLRGHSFGPLAFSLKVLNANHGGSIRLNPNTPIPLDTFIVSNTQD